MRIFRITVAALVVVSTIAAGLFGRGFSPNNTDQPAYASVIDVGHFLVAGGGNDNGNDGNGNNNNDNDGNGNGSTPSIVASGPVALGAGGSAGGGSGSDCARAGRETLITSLDGRYTVRVFPNLPQDVRISIRVPADLNAVPATPGQRVDAIVFQLVAENCSGGALTTLPVEVNLGIRYSDQDVAGLSEQNFTISRLDPADNQWKPTAKQANDPPVNYSSATITAMGFYALHVR